jgi:hypothetical protein
MEIPIKISQYMTSLQGQDAKNEATFIRMPKDLRRLSDISIGDSLTLKTNDGRYVLVTVQAAFAEDVKTDSLSAYITGYLHALVSTGGDALDVQLVDGITLGCDPELMVIDRSTGDLISAQYFLGLTKWKQVGYDGVLLELRPGPSTSEAMVIDNIYNLIVEARTHLNRCTMYPNLMMAGISAYKGKVAVAKNSITKLALYNHNTTLTAGFHLHFGIPKEILGGHREFVARQVVKALDYYVGFPSIVPEGQEDSYRRTVQGIAYGKPGQFRQDHRTFEYRTPGAALMKHPILAQGLIGLGAVVMEDVVSRIKVITHDYTRLGEIAEDADIKILYPHLPHMSEIFGSVCSPTTDQAKGHLEIIRRDIEKMVGYARRADSINNFFNNIETKFSYDVEENWRRNISHGERQQG